MHQLKINLTCLTLLTAIAATVINLPAPLSGSQAWAQTPAPRKVEADLLSQQGVQQFNTGQAGAALLSFQQALTIYREIKDRESESYALANLGVAYDSLGNYVQAIEYEQQWLSLARETKDRQSESKALANLGNTYADLGDLNSAVVYYKQNFALTKVLHDTKTNRPPQASDR